MVFIAQLALMCTVFATALLGGCATIQEGADSNVNSRAAIDSDAIKMRQTPKGAVLSFQDLVLFDSGRSNLRKESFPILDKVANILINYTKAQIVIEGHTDNQGGTDFNQQLSKARALSVKQALVARHVQPDRLTIKAAGFSKPLAPNDTALGRQKNRRVEVVMVGESVDKLTMNNTSSFDFSPELKTLVSSLGDTAKNAWDKLKESISKTTAN